MSPMLRVSLLALLLAGCGRAATDTSEVVDVDAGVTTARATLDRVIGLVRADEVWTRTLQDPRAIVRDGAAFASTGFAEARGGVPGAYGARFPVSADGAVRIAFGKDDAHVLEVSHRGAASSSIGELVDGSVVHRDAWPKADLVSSARADRVESFFLLREAGAPTVFALDVHLPSALSGARVEADGSLVFLEGEEPRLRVPRPAAIDAKGVRRDARLAWDGASITVTLDVSGLVYPIVLDPAIDRIRWTDVSTVTLPAWPPPGSTSPPRVTYPAGLPRTYGSLLHAPVDGGVLYLVGGTYHLSGGGYPYGFAGQLFAWNGSTWTAQGGALGVPGGPVDLSRRVGGIAWDEARSRLVWIGGGSFGSSGVHLDASEFDPITKAWTRVCDDDGGCYGSMPGVGATPSVTWAFGRTIVVYSNGTSYWNPATKRLVKYTLGTDLARSGAALAYDAARGVLVAFGGDAGQADTFEWDGTSTGWKKVATSGPPASPTPVATYDSVRKRVVLYAHTGASSPIYAWNGASWDLIAIDGGRPGARKGAAFAYDATRGRLVLFGGGDLAVGCVDMAPYPPHDLNRDLRVCNMLDTWSGMLFGGDCGPTRGCDPGTYCVDGVCCTSPCTGSCVRCDEPGSVGTCVSVVSATDPDSCTGTSTCDATGSCKKQQGAACGGGAECLSGNCIDGVCCSSACTGSCEACTLAGKVGTCSPLPKGSPGKGCGSYTCSGTTGACATTCAADADCAASAYCQGGACQPSQAKGATCARDRQCVGGRCVDGVCCDAACSGPCDVCAASLGASSDGTCTVLPASATPAACGAFKCSGTTGACAASCTSDADCSSTGWCFAGACVERKGKGQSCERTDQCAAGLTCADGVCCNEACDGACRACSAVNKASGDASGECGPAREGTNPGARCVGSDPKTCGLTGLCDATGSCAKYGAGTACGPTGSTTCDAGVVKGQVCDGLGTCKIDATGTSCAPGACKDGACTWACTTDTDCAGAAWCDAGTCRAKRATGAKCTTAAQCTSGFCADGVCCGSACDGSCEACDVAGAVGTCAAITGAPRPGHPACDPADPANPCSARSCDGEERAKCARFAGPEVECRPASCAKEVATFAASCDGSGACPAPKTQACQPYACGDAACKTTCSSDSDCKAGFVCDATTKTCTGGAKCDGHVVTKPDGATVDCAPFVCESGGTCKASCAVSTDCVAPAVCDPSGACVTPSAPTEGDGGCAFGAPGRSGPAFTVAGVGIVALLARRRRGGTGPRSR